MDNHPTSGPIMKLHDYQEYAKEFIKTHPYCGLFFDCGLGKSLITLAALWEQNPNCHVLIIAPKNIARNTWMDEIKKWNFHFRTKSFVVNEKGKDLTRKARLKLYQDVPNEPPTIYFINRELVTDLVKNMPIIDGQPVWYFPYVIIDELQSFKSYNSERFKALQYVRPCISNFIGLTGTPTPKGLMDLWSEIYLMDGGARLGHNITAYRNTFFIPGRMMNGYPIEWFPQPGAEEEIYKRVSDLVISMKNTKNPIPVIYNTVNVYMDDKEKALYKELMRTQVLELDEETTITAANAGVLQIRLSQMASGAIYTDKNNTYQIIHKRKLEQCQYIIENTGAPVLIAYHFKSDKEMLLDYFKDAVVFDGSPAMKEQWNNQQIPIMLIQPASSGFGLNLQDGGCTLIWYTLTWSLEEYIQCNARLARQGQKNTVIIHHLLTHGTVDDRILAALHRKDQTEQALIEAVKATIEDTLDD